MGYDGLGVAGYPDWTHCRECGTVAPGEAFLLDLERIDGRRRVCDRCAGQKAEYDGYKTYTEANVAEARATGHSEGGQRNLADDY